MMRCTAGLLAAAVLGGCTATRNERPWMGQLPTEETGGLVYLDMLHPYERPEGPLRDSAPSLVSVSRANWEPVVFVVPTDAVAAFPTYAHEVVLTRDTARQRGDFPTPLTALELSGDTRVVQAQEALLNPLIAGVDLVALPVRMVLRPPWMQVYSFPASYWRASPNTAQIIPDWVVVVPVPAETVPTIVEEEIIVVPLPERPEGPVRVPENE